MKKKVVFVFVGICVLICIGIVTFCLLQNPITSTDKNNNGESEVNSSDSQNDIQTQDISKKDVFRPEIIDLDTKNTFLITKNTKVKDVSIFGDNKYPELEPGDGLTFNALPETKLAKDEIVMRNKYLIESNAFKSAMTIGGISLEDDSYFADARIIYLLLCDFDSYQIMGLTCGMSIDDVINVLGEPQNKFSNFCEYYFDFEDESYGLVLDFEEGKLYRAQLSIGNYDDGSMSDEEFEEMLKEEFGAENVQD